MPTRKKYQLYKYFLKHWKAVYSKTPKLSYVTFLLEKPVFINTLFLRGKNCNWINDMKFM